MYLGQTISFRDFIIPEENRREHLHVMGVTGKGKSKFLTRLFQQDIMNGKGVCVIDPHGTMIDEMLSWLYRQGADGMFRGQPIYLIEPSNLDYVVGFDPLGGKSANDFEPASRAMNAVAAVWGDADINQTPTLAGLLPALFYFLRVHNLSLAESPLVLENLNRIYAAKLNEGLNNPIIEAQFNELKGMKEADFVKETKSTQNRLRRFLANDPLRLMFGQKKQVFDLSEAIKQNAIILLNLSANASFSEEGSSLSDTDIDLIGSLFINSLRHAASKRPKSDHSNTFYLYIDECSRFLGKDIGMMLTEMRKYGLGLVLAHQHTGQLKEKGESLEMAMRNIQNMICFATPDPDDAMWVANKSILGEMRYNMEIYGTERPTVTGQTRIIERSVSQGVNESQTVGKNSSVAIGNSSSSSDSSSRSINASAKYLRGKDDFDTFDDGDISSWRFNEQIDRDDEEYEPRMSHSGSRSDSESNSFSNSFGISNASTKGLSRGITYSPVYVSEFEDLPTKYFSADDQVRRRADRIVSMQKGQAIAKIGGNHSQFVQFNLPEDESINRQAANALRGKILETLTKRGIAQTKQNAIISLNKRQNEFIDRIKTPKVGSISLFVDDQEDFKE